MVDVFDALGKAEEAACVLLSQCNEYKRRLDLALKDRERAEVELIKLRGLKLDDSERRELEKLRAFRSAVDKAYRPADGTTVTSFGAVSGVGGAGNSARITYS